jgi:signal peptide peptidase SppA
MRQPRPSGIAVIHISGLCLFSLDAPPFSTGMAQLKARVDAAAATPSVGTILFVISSPGGVVTGVPEAARAIRDAREKKRTLSFVAPLAASAAYWLASQAHEVIAMPSAHVGSIGVFLLHTDFSKALDSAGIKPTFIQARISPKKIDGNPFEPLTDSARRDLQADVDAVAATFVRDLVLGRRSDPVTVRQRFGQGRLLMAKDAKAAGMVDTITADLPTLLRDDASRRRHERLEMLRRG